MFFGIFRKNLCILEIPIVAYRVRNKVWVELNSDFVLFSIELDEASLKASKMYQFHIGTIREQNLSLRKVYILKQNFWRLF